MQAKATGSGEPYARYENQQSLEWCGGQTSITLFLKGDKMKMKKLVSLMLAFSIFFAGCAGREANPIPIYRIGDY